jgi:hypothetical protein
MQECLSYLDESSNPPKWKCVDECLQKKDGLLCGYTDHFTSFAVLLGGSTGGGGGGCGSSDGGTSVLVYLSAAAIGAALVVIFVVIAVYEGYKRTVGVKSKLHERKIESKYSRLLEAETKEDQ